MSALHGIRVLELAETVGGEYCGKLLADFGAEIIKVERPDTGSPTRRFEPLANTSRANGESSGLFAYLNTGKQSLTLGLSADQGRTTLGQLLSRVDVVIDDHGVDWLKARQLDADSLAQSHPALVFCSVTDFGLAPPEDRAYSHDINVIHASGWGYHTPTGVDPQRPPLKGAGRFLASYEAGLEAALCVTASLCERLDSNAGRFVEVSKQQVLASRVDYVLGQMIAGDMDVSTDRAAFDLAGPAGIFACKDGYAYIWMSAPAHWDALRELLGKTENTDWMQDFPANWMERECTPERVAVCRQHLASWLATQNKHEAAEQAQTLGLTLVAVNNAEDLMASPQFQFREFFTELDHPTLGKTRYPTTPYKMSITPARAHQAAPLLGEHSETCMATIARDKP